MKLIFFLIVCLLFSCKYEDGPIISFFSAEKRVEGIYKVEKYEIAGIDSIIEFNQISCSSFPSITFNKNGEIKVADPSIGCGISGNWNLKNKNAILKITMTAFRPISFEPWYPGKSTNWDILELKDDKLTISTTFKNKLYKLWLIE